MRYHENIADFKGISKTHGFNSDPTKFRPTEDINTITNGANELMKPFLEKERDNLLMQKKEEVKERDLNDLANRVSKVFNVSSALNDNVELKASERFGSTLNEAKNLLQQKLKSEYGFNSINSALNAITNPNSADPRGRKLMRNNDIVGMLIDYQDIKREETRINSGYLNQNDIQDLAKTMMASHPQLSFNESLQEISKYMVNNANVNEKSGMNLLKGEASDVARNNPIWRDINKPTSNVPTSNNIYSNFNNISRVKNNDNNVENIENNIENNTLKEWKEVGILPKNKLGEFKGLETEAINLLDRNSKSKAITIKELNFIDSMKDDIKKINESFMSNKPKEAEKSIDNLMEKYSKKLDISTDDLWNLTPEALEKLNSFNDKNNDERNPNKIKQQVFNLIGIKRQLNDENSEINQVANYRNNSLSNKAVENKKQLYDSILQNGNQQEVEQYYKNVNKYSNIMKDSQLDIGNGKTSKINYKLNDKDDNNLFEPTSMKGKTLKNYMSVFNTITDSKEELEYINKSLLKVLNKIDNDTFTGKGFKNINSRLNELGNEFADDMKALDDFTINGVRMDKKKMNDLFRIILLSNLSKNKDGDVIFKPTEFNPKDTNSINNFMANISTILERNNHNVDLREFIENGNL